MYSIDIIKASILLYYKLKNNIYKNTKSSHISTKHRKSKIYKK